MSTKSYELRLIAPAVKRGVRVANAAAAMAAAGGGIEALGALAGEPKRARIAAGPAAAAWETLRDVCAAAGTEVVNEVTTTMLSGVLLARAALDRVSVKTLGGFLSNVRAACCDLRKATWAVSEEDYRWLRRALLPELALMYPYKIDRVRPLTLGVLRRVEAHLRPYLEADDPFCVQMWAIMCLSFGGLLRSIDYCDKRALLRNDQLWIEENVEDGDGLVEGDVLAADLPFRKNAKGERDTDFDTVYVPECQADGGVYGALAAMRHHLSLSGREIGGDDGFVFHRVSRTAGGEVLGDKYTYDQVLKDFRWVLEQAGVPNSDEYGLHSPRSGGATYLLGLGVEWDVVKRLGCWRADASMEQYDRRATLVAATIMKATRRGAEATRRGDKAARRGGKATRRGAKG